MSRPTISKSLIYFNDLLFILLISIKSKINFLFNSSSKLLLFFIFSFILFIYSSGKFSIISSIISSVNEL